LFEDLGVLIRLYARLRDREQLIELIFEGTTADLLKDIITIFYAPLAQVYKAASIADSLGDMQNFINDLIRTVEQGEELSQENPSLTVQLFIDLVGRHEQAFYSFVHKVHSKGEGLFDSLMKWIELFLTFVREGLTDGNEKIALEYVLPHTGPERVEILKEVDAVALYHYKIKVAYEVKVRRRFTKQETVSADGIASQALVDNVIGELQFGSLLKGDAEEIYAEEDEEAEWDSSDESSEYETDSDDGGSHVSSSGGGPHPVAHSSHIGISGTHGDSLHPSHPHHYLPSDTHARRASFGSTSSASHHQSSASTFKKDSYLDNPLPPSPASSAKSGFRHSVQDSMHKPLPPPPPPSAADENGHRPGVKLRRRRKPGELSIDPPELKAIPALLPVFVELIRNYLRPRPVS